MDTFKSITVIEDDAPIRDMYVMKLRAQGYKVSEAKDGLEALRVLKEVKPDLILLDIKMPHLPGQEVLRRVREAEWGQDMKVIVLTNISRGEAPADFRFLGVDRYIVKLHYTPSQVLEIVREVLAD